MHLRSLVLKGFKSFPDRTRLDFAPGVSVVVGPNGSGKSNITDAVLWAMGEQSPLAVRGQKMQDVIFAGGPGLPSRKAAEVEVVLDNSDGLAGNDFTELSIKRRLERSGEGEYRLNGARCRLVDVLESLSDTGLGKEMHSVVSQGRVEAIIHSKPRDRRALIEEAAGLGKHRKRRRRAQLKLERTEQNLSRALDVEREARSHLRPLKRQAEAAELHERLERQQLEARLELAREDVRAARTELERAEQQATAAREKRAELQKALTEVSDRREQAERAFAHHSELRERVSSALFASRSSVDGLELRLERARDAASAAAEDAKAAATERERLRGSADEDGPAEGPAERIAELERELAEIDAERERSLDAALTGLVAERAAAERALAESQAVAERRRAELDAADRVAEEARAERRAADARLESARAAAAQAGAELARLNQFLGSAAPGRGSGRSLAERLTVDEGYELALSAALGATLMAGVVADVEAGEELLDETGEDGGLALLTRAARSAEPAERAAGALPRGAERLLDHVRPDADVEPLAAGLLRDVWVVESLTDLPKDFPGVAVTRGGRALAVASGELRQAPLGGPERVLEARNRRERLSEESAGAAGQEAAAASEVARAQERVSATDTAREQAEGQLRSALRKSAEASEAADRAAWLIERRKEAPEQGPAAVRRAELAADLRAEQRLTERAERARAELRRRIEALEAKAARCGELAGRAERAAEALEAARAAVAERRDALADELKADEEVGQRTAAELRDCAAREAELQAELAGTGEVVTQTEVSAQRLRDAEAEAAGELNEVAGRLSLRAEPAEEELAPEQREELEGRIERLTRRREQLGPVNPLAKAEYEEAVAHVDELEAGRRDLESAMSELKDLIAETDRRIRESFERTFETAARNFEDVVQHLFPGGRGRLRLVYPEGPRAVIGGQEDEAPDDNAEGAESESAENAAEAEEAPPEEEPGVEVEVTPGGKSMRRLSLLSGGEKSLVALAFMFAVFLARPCPFYILDEVEAALDDLNIDRFLQLVRRFSDRAQFIVVTHQKRTMDAADAIYGVSMGADGVTKVISRRLGGEPLPEDGEELADQPVEGTEAA